MKFDRRTAFTSSISNLLGIPGKKILTFLISVLIINNFSVSEYGQFNLFLGFLSLTVGLSFGIDKIVQRYFPKHNLNNKQAAYKALVILLFLRIAFFIILLFIVLGLSYFKLINPAKFNFPFFTIAIAIAILQIITRIFIQVLITAFLEHKFYNYVNIASSSIKLLLIFIFKDEGIKILFLIWFVVEMLVFISFIIRFLFNFKILKLNIVESFKQKLPYKQYFDYGKYLIVATIGTQLLSASISFYFLSYYHGNKFVGLFGFATSIATTLSLFAPSNLMFNITTPFLINKVDNKKDINEIKRYIVTFLKLNLFFWTLLVVFISFNLEYIIIALFKKVYLQTIPIIIIFLIILYANIIKSVFEPIARANENTKVYIFTLIAAIFNVLSCFVFIPKYNIYGALISVGISLVIQSTGIAYFVSKNIRLKLESNFFLKLILNVFIIIIVFSVSKYLFNDDNIFLFVFTNTFMLAFSFALFKYNRCFNSFDRKFINSFLPKHLFVF